MESTLTYTDLDRILQEAMRGINTAYMLFPDLNKPQRPYGNRVSQLRELDTTLDRVMMLLEEFIHHKGVLYHHVSTLPVEEPDFPGTVSTPAQVVEPPPTPPPRKEEAINQDHTQMPLFKIDAA